MTVNFNPIPISARSELSHRTVFVPIIVSKVPDWCPFVPYRDLPTDALLVPNPDIPTLTLEHEVI
jgi:hypothetical protein